MKNNNILLSILKRDLGEYLSAKKIHEKFEISLNFVYEIIKNEKIKTRKKYGRTEIELESFLTVIELGTNIKAVENIYCKEDFDINNFYNWGAKNQIESYLESLLLDELGYFTSVNEVAKLLGVSKTTCHELMAEGKIMYLNIKTRKVIVTQSLIPYFREARAEK